MPQDLRRRSVLRALAAAAVGGTAVSGLSGCDLSLPGRRDEPGTDATASTDPDERSLGEARAAIREALTTIETAIAAHPALGTRFTSLASLHRAHLDALDASDSTPTAGTPSANPTATASGRPAAPRNAARAIAGVRNSERRLHTVLTGLAQRVESGPLARLLASMAAALTQAGGAR